ncbi:Type 1 glutamine amidotransferase-like domain-containing protein [Candidatus Saccharibacteria bacterium]|nr:Type 1 glutamine amidotransferase-like domain-containing protein [Candidatus Saccharibacteria bacterium]
MKLYLGSYKPWETDEDFSRCTEMIGENKKVAVIMNPIDYSDDLERVKNSFDETKSFFESLGLEPFQLDLRDYFGNHDELEKVLHDIGMIFIYGGNTFILRRAFRQSGLDKLLPELLRNGVVYCGFSSGSCVLAPTLHGLDDTDDPNIVPSGYESEIIWDGLNLIPYSILPHYNSDHPESESIGESIEYFEKNNLPYKTLRDGEAIVINNEEVK